MLLSPSASLASLTEYTPDARNTDSDSVLTIAGICLGVTMLTEVTSNTATSNLLMPLLAEAAKAAGTAPAVLMIPATMSASCAFMLPVATPPNAVVFGTGQVTLRRMAREGIALNLIGVVVITTAAMLLVPR